jgi:GTP-binding protein
MQGRGVGEMLDEIVRRLPMREGEPADAQAIRIAVMGRPNVGKSSLVNRLLGEERMIVDQVPGTTRDAVDTPFRYHGRPMVLVDTAGIRRKLSSQPDFEFYATLRAIRSLETAHVALLVLDSGEPVSRQDLRIARMIDDAGCACVWVFNKWDLVEKDDKTSAHMLAAVREEISFQAHAPAEFVSALTVQRVSRLPQRIVEVFEAARQKVATGDLNACIRKAVDHNPPRALHGDRPIRIYYATQVKTAPPTFALFVSRPERLAQDYARYLVRELRARFGFSGSPIRLQIRKSS